MKFSVLPIDRGSHRTRLGMEVAVWKWGLGKVSGMDVVLACGVSGAVWGFWNLSGGLPLSV